MHRTVASKSGGYNVECTPEETAEMEAEWKKNAKEHAAKEAAAALEDKEADEAMDALCAALPRKQALALKKKLKV